MKSRSTLLIVISIAFVALVVLLYFFLPPVEKNDSEAGKPINWTEHYDVREKSPYGMFIFKELLFKYYEDLGKKQYLISTDDNYSGYDELAKSKSIYFLIDKDLSRLQDIDLRFLFDYVADGNFGFVSAEQHANPIVYLLWTNYILRIRERDHFTVQFINANKIQPKEYRFSITDNGTKKANKYISLEKNAEFYSGRLDSLYFDTDRGELDSASWENAIFENELVGEATELQVLKDEQRFVYVRINYGEGAFFIHFIPYAFTNISLIREENVEHFEKILSYLPPVDLMYVDEGFQPRQHSEGGDNETPNGTSRTSPLQFILSVQSLSWAYYMTLITLLLFILFRIKRRQKPIPARGKIENSTLNFAATLSELYFQQGKHQYLVMQKQRLLMNFIRERYYLKSRTADEAFIRSLAVKSGISQEKLNELFKSLKNGAEQIRLSDEQFISIHQLTEYFYKNCK
ncbi:MAG: hypothetical protein ACK40M_11000 [Flavobacteriales bacterium]